MHRLQREWGAEPACLHDYDHMTQGWGDLAADCKRRARLALIIMQGIPGVTGEDDSEYGARCAYCESAIHAHGHIEHFWPKTRACYPELTFVWHNLFVACGATKHCGHYKGQRDPGQAVKPDEDDPDAFLHCHSSGEIRTRTDVGEADRARAQQTCDVFNLNEPGLKAKRRTAVKVYKENNWGVTDELALWPPELRAEFLAGEIKETRYHPYATTIKHFCNYSAHRSE